MACITFTHKYRLYLIKKLILPKILSRDNFLEVGCGTGDFSAMLQKRNFSGRVIDLSAVAVKEARKKLLGTKIKVSKNDLFNIRGKYNNVFMFEVLEHIKDDDKALAKLNNLIEIDGHLILSVPAHMRSWGRDDEWGGHFRRYERRELYDLLADNGFEVEIFICYGFPVFNFSRWIYNKMSEITSKPLEKIRKKEATLITGIDKENSRWVEKVNLLSWMLPVIFLVSNWFIKTDLGVGFLVMARKKFEH